MARPTYRDELKQQAVARHLAGESQAAIAESIGVPRQTVTSWAASADGIRQSLDSGPLSLKKELADQAAGVIHKALHIIDATLEHYIAQIEVGEYPKPSQLRDITVTAGISRDIHLDYTDGRKGMEIQVDARQQSVLSGLSLEELRAIVASGKEAGEGVDREADLPSPTETGGPSRPDLKEIPTSSPYNDPPSLYGDPREAGVRST